MLTTILTAVTILLTLLLFVFWYAFNRPDRRKTIYVCDICNTRDCVCREKR